MKSIQEVKEWTDAAIKDGWKSFPTYDHEPIEQAMRLVKGEYIASAIMRPANKKPHWAIKKDEASLHLWKDKGLTGIKPPFPYSMEAIKVNEKICDKCQKPSSELHHVGFANKSCNECLPTMKKELEYEGWCN